jgi:hypothetical protein
MALSHISNGSGFRHWSNANKSQAFGTSFKANS